MLCLFYYVDRFLLVFHWMPTLFPWSIPSNLLDSLILFINPNSICNDMNRNCIKQNQQKPKSLQSTLETFNLRDDACVSDRWLLLFGRFQSQSSRFFQIGGNLVALFSNFFYSLQFLVHQTASVFFFFLFLCLSRLSAEMWQWLRNKEP